MSQPELYYFPEQPPCRSVMMVARAIGIELKMNYVNMLKAEHLTAEFAKLTPTKMVPVLMDGDFVLPEGRAICQYLCNKYAGDDKWYPRDPQKRALVDHRLFFEAWFLYRNFFDYYLYAIQYGGTFEEARRVKFDSAMAMFETFLESTEGGYATGSQPTIADICLFTTVNQIETLAHNLAPYPKILAWLQRCKETLPGYEELCKPGCDSLAAQARAACKMRGLVLPDEQE